MAINFEAANMAGYNNPKIEVFKAALAEDGQTLAQYPNKAAIMGCINRGTIPAIICTNPVANQIFFLPLMIVQEAETSVTIYFAASSAAAGSVTIAYSPDSDVPEYMVG